MPFEFRRLAFATVLLLGVPNLSRAEGIQTPTTFSNRLVSSTHVPGKVLAGIKRKAARDHPDDDSTQLYVSNKQTEAYLKLRRLHCPRRIPTRVFTRIRVKAAGSHPGDFSTQLYVIRKQVEAYEQLQDMKVPTGVAGKHFFRLKAKAQQKQPRDYSTQLFLLNQQVDKYLLRRQSGENGEAITRHLLEKM